MTRERQYLKGNEAVAYGALEAGLNAYFAYPITPSSEIPETLAKEFGSPRYPQFRAFLQAASEIEAINMVLGAAATGAKAMTATSSPGFSLKQEGISYAAGMELPILVVDINRGGPGLGNIAPEQGDYFQCTRGGGHGDYHSIVLAPNSVQEMASFPQLAFSLAFKHRNPVIILGDAFIGQLKEDISFPKVVEEEFDTSWAATGATEDGNHILNSLHLDPEVQERWEAKLQEKYRRIREEEARYEAYLVEDADVVLVAYGITSRLCKSVVNRARSEEVKAGLFRPITLFPFPHNQLSRIARRGARFLVVEMNAGQMLYDVRLAVGALHDVEFLGRLGGLLPSGQEIYAKMEAMLDGAD